MASRAKDWMAQAERDLAHARHSLDMGDFEWACFAAQQAAEKGLKGVYQQLGAEVRGHDLDGLLQGLASRVKVPKALFDRAKELGRRGRAEADARRWQ